MACSRVWTDWARSFRNKKPAAARWRSVAAPIPPILGIQFGMKFGGRGWFTLFVVIGAVVGVWLFNATGAPAVVIEAALKPSSGGGSPFGGF